jgi:hypothetical protein
VYIKVNEKDLDLVFENKILWHTEKLLGAI